MKDKKSRSSSKLGLAAPQSLAARACLIRVLARVLGYPTRERFELLGTDLIASKLAVEFLPKGLQEPFLGVASTIEGLSHEEFERAYLDVFTHICAADCNPRESSYLAKHVFQVSQEVALVSGFYRSFGLEVGGESPDHISVELEFMAFLCYREFLEATNGADSARKEMRDAQRAFFNHHLGQWVRRFVSLMKRRARSGVIYDAACLLDLLMIAESKRLGAYLARATGSLELDSENSSINAMSPLRLANRELTEEVFHAC